MMKKATTTVFVFTLLIITFSISMLHAQVAINSDGSSPNASAMLDITSSDKGILIPRMTTSERENISSPATGLLVYDTDENAFWYYKGSTWSEIGSGGFVSENGITHSQNNTDDFLFGTDGLNYSTGTEYKFFFDNSLGAFRAGTVTGTNWDESNLGDYSVAFGYNNMASGDYSFSGGLNSLASGKYAITYGYQNTASGQASVSLGRSNTASGLYSVALGYSTVASDNYSFAMGNNAEATADNAIAMGDNAAATANSAIALGNETVASGNVSTAFGSYSEASGTIATAFGLYSTAPSYAEVALGLYNTTYTPQSTTSYNSNDRLFVVGNGSSSSNTSDALVIYKNGDAELNGELTVADTLSIKDAYKFPMTDGDSAQTLITDGSGALSWETIETNTDEQTLSLENDSLTISNGNSIDLSDFRKIDDLVMDVVSDNAVSDVSAANGDAGLNGSESQIWQSFIPNYSGYLSEIEIKLGDPNIYDSYDGGYFRVYEGEGTGGTLMGEKTLASMTSSGWHSIDLTSDSIIIESGETYTFYIEDSVNSFAPIVSFPATYANGVSSSFAVDLVFKVYTTPITTSNIFTDNNSGFNLSYLDTLHFNDGTSQSSASYNATQNLQLNDYWLSNDGGDEGIQIDDDGNATVSGTLTIGNTYTLPSSDGTLNQYLTTDGSGMLNWADLSLGNLTDADNDTKIQVEESSDEDIIRFDLGGTEFLKLHNGRIENLNTGYSVFIGEGAGENDDYSDNENVFIGYQSGSSNTTGKENAFIGYQSGNSNTTGEDNIFVGHSAGYKNTTGTQNIFIGTNSGYKNTTGTYNVFLGRSAGYNSTGSYNVFLGRSAGTDETGSDKLYIENSSSSSPLIYGEFDNDRIVINGNDGDNSNNRTLFVNGSIGATSAFNNDSDRRLKTNIQTIPNALDKVLEMRGVTYKWKDGREKGDRMGFIAQEVEPILPEVVDNENDHYTMQYAPITAVLVEAMKEQQAQIDKLSVENEQLKAQLKKINELEAKLEALLNNQ